MAKRITTEDFIARAIKVHGDKYDYSQSECVGATEKIAIICPEHGPWRSQASSHLSGTGCPDCGGRKQLTTEKFITRARKDHGNKFDYSKATYKNSVTNLTITCPEHGEFRQRPVDHLKGAGCTNCGKIQRGLSKRGSTRDFLRRAKKVHGNRYDYSKSVYVRGHDKLTIICRSHGEFNQTPGNHLSGFGCKLCGFENAGQYLKKTSDSFIAEAKALHGDRYDYSEVDYKDVKSSVNIICRKHGAFEQTPDVHLRPSGCIKCSYEERGDGSRSSTEEFIQKAQAIHGEKFDYSLVQYVASDEAIEIVCKLHGKFDQSPSAHLQGQGGCPTCRWMAVSEKNFKGKEQFIEEARKIHGDKYDYSRVNYVGAREHVIVSCPIDGEFSQQAGAHLSGNGCPKCSRRGQGAPRNLVRALRGEFDSEKASFVYIIQFKFPYSDTKLYKVGSGSGTRVKTTENSIRKIGGLELEVWRREFSTTGEAIVYEHLAHEQIEDHQFVVLPEFKFPGYSEVFLKRPDMDQINQHPVFIKYRSGARWDPREVAVV